MKNTLVVAVLLFLLCAGLAAQEITTRSYGSLKLATVNVWSGSDYQGLLAFGEWETEAVREQRYQNLVNELRRLNPDLLFLQEVNPVRGYSRRMAQDLGLDEIHQVCIGGLKIFGLGIPKGFQEGNAILAKPKLKLSITDDWKLSGGPGIYSDNFTFHLDETISALVGQIVYRDKPINLVCVHLSAYPELSPALRDELDALALADSLTTQEYWDIVDQWNSGLRRREREAQLLLQKVSGLEDDVPLIMGGDFNATPGSDAMLRLAALGEFTETSMGGKPFVTWDAANNPNTLPSTLRQDARGNPNTHWENFNALNAAVSRRLDYLLLSDEFDRRDILSHQPFLNEPRAGSHPSDHYGVFSEVSLDQALRDAPGLFDAIPKHDNAQISLLPIVMYDTDTGFGYGVKSFLWNLLHANESFDLILFQSTGGERWYKLEFSLPDRELRQRKKYPLAVDLKIDYDKWINNNFFGVGSGSSFANREKFTKEPFEVLLNLTHPFSRYLNGQLGFRFKHVSAYNYLPGRLLDQYLNTPGSLRDPESAYLSNILSLRYDTRDSFNNPSRGYALQYDFETNWPQHKLMESVSAKSLQFDWGDEFYFLRNSLSAQYYTVLWYPKTVLALRLQGQQQSGDNIPFQAMLPLGGGTTLRGTPAERYLVNTTLVGNAEIRFPIYKALGGVIGYDAGIAADSPADVSLDKLASNPVFGLRLYLYGIIARLDIGLGRDAMGLYFNFGHAF